MQLNVLRQRQHRAQISFQSSWASTSVSRPHCNTQIGPGLNVLFIGDVRLQQHCSMKGEHCDRTTLACEPTRMAGPECVRRQRSLSPPRLFSSLGSSARHSSACSGLLALRLGRPFTVCTKRHGLCVVLFSSLAFGVDWELRTRPLSHSLESNWSPGVLVFRTCHVPSHTLPLCNTLPQHVCSLSVSA